ncbi:cell division protein ZapA [Halocola ammonii]
MSELSIKLNIGGRVYPLTIDRSEEEVIRKAAKVIEENMRVFQANYAVKDKQDLLAMTALQMSTQLLKTTDNGNNDHLLDQLKELDGLADQMLK